MSSMSLTELSTRLDHGKRIPAYVQKLKHAGLSANDPEALSTAVDTRTSQSSTTPWAGQPVGRALQYGPGHAPVDQSAVNAVVEASGPWAPVGWLNDATQNGRAYAFYVKGYAADWLAGWRRQSAAIIARAPSAWKEAVDEVSDGN